MKISNPSRVLALLTAGVLSTSVMLHPAPARADKAKTYKYGAVALGAVGAYLLSKGKTVAGAAALGAGAYAYKKGEDTRKANNNRYGNRYGYNNGDRYAYNNGGYNNGSGYDNGSYNNGGYNNGGYNNGGYNNGGYNNGKKDRYRVPANNRLGNRDNNRNSEYRAHRNEDRHDQDDD